MFSKFDLPKDIINIIMRGLKLVKNISRCNNRICYCAEYIDFSKISEIELYKECLQVDRAGKYRDIVSHKIYQWFTL